MKDAIQQYQLLTEGVAAFRPKDRTVMMLNGSDRTRFLQNFCTADVSSIAPGSGSEAFILNVKGKVIGHIYVLVHPEKIELNTVAHQGESLCEHLERYIIREDVVIRDESSQYAHWVISGPDATRSLANAGLTWASNINYLQHQPFQSGPIQGSLTRVCIANESDFLMRVSLDHAEPTAQWLAENWISTISEEVFDAGRLENGFPYFGRDITDANLPQELGRDAQAISFSKGCYLGQETVARLDAMGHVNWKLAKLVATEDTELVSGQEILVDGKVGMRVRSVAWDPQRNLLKALAFVRPNLLSADHRMKLERGEVHIEWI